MKITSEAIREIRKMAESKNVPQGFGLRIGVNGGKGCSGVDFTLGFDQPGENDISYVVEGIPIYIRKPEVMYLLGKHLVYFDDGTTHGFLFLDDHQAESITEAR
ncbi:MAG: iron-sulfur cluster assembly accessory protein [Cyclobacteriaceae bacterium]|nr:iron-sulfur cluster assembly accessory protein [Cyclobacteriaceae bacterium]